MKNSDKILAWATEIQAIAQTGLYYCTDKFDAERFQRLREISADMLAEKFVTRNRERFILQRCRLSNTKS